MVNQQTLQGNWNEVKGKLRTKWGQLTGDELQSFDGNVDRLVGMIQRKTGEARTAIEQFLEEATANGSSSISGVVDNAKKYAQDAAGKVQETTKQAAETVQYNFDEAQQMVKRRPVESVAVCFGAGVLAGVVLGLMIRSK